MSDEEIKKALKKYKRIKLMYIVGTVAMTIGTVGMFAFLLYYM